MNFQAADSVRDRGVSINGFVTHVELLGNERDPALLIVHTRDYIARAVADKVMEKLGPAIDAAISEAFKPSDPNPKPESGEAR